MWKPTSILLLILMLAGCGGGGSGASGTAAAAEAAARSYVDAYNARDGHAICDAFVSQLRHRMDDTAGGLHLSCPRLVAGYIGYGEESDTPVFRHVSIGSLSATVHGNDAAVRVREKLTFDSSDPTRRHVAISDAIYLVWQEGRWHVAKPGAIYYGSQSAYQVPPTVLDPPVTQSEAGAPAPRRAPAPPCNGPTLARWSDPAGDAPAAVDLTSVTAVSAPGAICIRLASTAVPPPGTVYAFSLEQPAGLDATHVLQANVRVGRAGALLIGPDDLMRGARAGWDGAVLSVSIPEHPSRLDPRAPLHLSARLDSLQSQEPLIRHPLTGSDVIQGDTHQLADAPPGTGEAEALTPTPAPTLQECVDTWNAHDAGRAPIGYDPFHDVVVPGGSARPASSGFIGRSAWVATVPQLGCSVDFQLGDVHAVFQRTRPGRWYGLSFLNSDLWQPPANACQAPDGRLSLGTSCSPIHVPAGQRRPLLQEYGQMATRRARQAVAKAGGPVWWAGPRPVTSALAAADADIAWATGAGAAIVYAWREGAQDPTSVPANRDLVVLSYKRGGAPERLPCGSPCMYTVLNRLDRGDATILVIARTEGAPPAREARMIEHDLRLLRR